MNHEPIETETYTDFVNDECGDTMWDKVLAQKENLKISNIVEEQLSSLSTSNLEKLASIDDLIIEEKHENSNNHG